MKMTTFLFVAVSFLSILSCSHQEPLVIEIEMQGLPETSQEAMEARIKSSLEKIGTYHSYEVVGIDFDLRQDRNVAIEKVMVKVDDFSLKQADPLMTTFEPPATPETHSPSTTLSDLLLASAAHIMPSSNPPMPQQSDIQENSEHVDTEPKDYATAISESTANSESLPSELENISQCTEPALMLIHNPRWLEWDQNFLAFYSKLKQLAEERPDVFASDHEWNQVEFQSTHLQGLISRLQWMINVQALLVTARGKAIEQEDKVYQALDQLMNEVEQLRRVFMEIVMPHSLSVL